MNTWDEIYDYADQKQELVTYNYDARELVDRGKLPEYQFGQGLYGNIGV